MIFETIDAIPRHLVMPQQTEMIFTTICGVGLILSLVYMALQIRKRGGLVPLYAYVGAALAFLYEPFADYMVLVYFPEQGQLTAIDVVDRRVPWFWVHFLKNWVSISGFGPTMASNRLDYSDCHCGYRLALCVSFTVMLPWYTAW